ncbi:MAG TPA: hypothetical protein VGS78_17440 [Candidatus Sulfotelmatobacter sp.]|nr:hypothetical protein [Candidatus Sulfotelmatobacter sp.]
MAALMGGVSRQAEAATFPPDRFYCLLDELPLHLIPPPARQALHRLSHDAQPLVLNPNCIITSGEQIPESIAGSLDSFSAFALQGTIAWIRSSSTGSSLPFWLGHKLGNLVRTLSPDEPIPEAFPAEARDLFRASGILIPQSLPLLDAGIDKSVAMFRDRGYAPLRDLIHPFHVAALRRYYRDLIRTGAVQLGDLQSPRRYVAYNEPVARFFHRHIATALSAVAGEPLKPSYVYLASYLSGAELKKHTDREQCEFSITLCLDFSPEPTLATPWPIRLDTPRGTVAVYQAIGDGLAYRGTRLPHYRDPLPEGQTSTSIFFHYVSADFEGSLE